MRRCLLYSRWRFRAYSCFASSWRRGCKATGLISAWRPQEFAASKWGRTDAFGFASGRFVHWTSDAHSGRRVGYSARSGIRSMEQRNQQSLHVSFSQNAVQFFGFGWESGRFTNALKPEDLFQAVDDSLLVPCFALRYCRDGGGGRRTYDGGDRVPDAAPCAATTFAPRLTDARNAVPCVALTKKHSTGVKGFPRATCQRRA